MKPRCLEQADERGGAPAARDAEISATLPSERSLPAAAPAAEPPFAGWDRYELLELLGKGGMGSVYRARDRRLDRTIAIKFILGAAPTLTIRFLREARAQARIDHPNVCRVYEVGEVEGRAYIALQYVDGEPLHAAARRMSLAEKIAAVRDVALAVHEAHQLGIVHRDLKPGNVLVERTEAGRWLPVVMDFGLAREATVEVGITESGMPLGTPAYMSPEQARGDVHAIDRRSDVYSLGATLYELLTGSVPFPAASLVTALARVLHDDPPAPRSLAPGLPVDLETIVLKCLAKDPAQRYPTARALADDLGRHLDGQPILGRRRSLWQRLRLPPTLRHRRTLIVLACAVAVELGVASLGVGACLGSRTNTALAEDHARLAGRLGQQTKEIELSLRSAYQLPLHDTRADRDHVRAQMRAIGATAHGLGALGDAFVHDALGRGHLALHEWREAADELGRAAAAGLQTPELHAELGRALGVRYQAELEAARRADDKAGFPARQRALEAQYLTPALAELAQSRRSGEDTGLLDAQIAFDRHELAAAEQRALAVPERSPGFYEARKLAASAAYDGAVEAFDRGDDDLARTGLERAAARYEGVSEIARSDASVYEAAADTWLRLARLDIRQGRSPLESIECALDLVDNALRADPDDGQAYMIRVYVLLRWYRAASPHGADERRALLDRIAQAAERAVELDPGCPGAWRALGVAYAVSQEAGRAPWWPGRLHELGELLALWPDAPERPDRGTVPCR